MRGAGAICNDRAIRCSAGTSLGEGSTGVGFSGRTGSDTIRRLVDGVLDAGGVFWRNGSGGLSLTYVAQGRILGYCEAHMNAWDYLAGQSIVAEAGAGSKTPMPTVRSHRAVALGLQDSAFHRSRPAFCPDERRSQRRNPERAWPQEPALPHFPPTCGRTLRRSGHLACPARGQARIMVARVDGVAVQARRRHHRGAIHEAARQGPAWGGTGPICVPDMSRTVGPNLSTDRLTAGRT